MPNLDAELGKHGKGPASCTAQSRHYVVINTCKPGASTTFLARSVFDAVTICTTAPGTTSSTFILSSSTPPRFVKISFARISHSAARNLTNLDGLDSLCGLKDPGVLVNNAKELV